MTPLPVVSRRALLGAAGLALAAAAGSAAGLLRPEPPTGRPGRPPLLVAAIERETTLLAGIDGSLAADGSDGVLTAIRADHLAHRYALQSALRGYAAAPAPQSISRTPARDRSELRRAEQLAAQTSRTAADRLPGTYAALLASIAACEATHAELLS